MGQGDKNEKIEKTPLKFFAVGDHVIRRGI